MLKELVNISLLSLLVLATSGARAEEKQLNRVKMSLLQPFTILQNFSDERYRRVIESSVYYGLGENEKKLTNCGYDFEVVTNYYNPQDPNELKEKAELIDSRDDLWLVLGPASGIQFVNAANNLEKTVMISPMAEAQAVADLPPPFFTGGVGMANLASAAIQALKVEEYGQRYGVFTNKNCLECQEFTEAFNQQAQANLVNEFNLEGETDSPDIAQLTEMLKKNPVDFLVLPNASRFSGHVMSKLHPIFPELKFVGTVGWGQTVWSFLTDYDLPETIAGLTVRSGLSPEQMNKVYNIASLDQNWFNTSEIISAPHMAYFTIGTVRRMTDLLCELKPQTKQELTEIMAQLPAGAFRNQAGIGVYKLNGNNLEFAYKQIQKTKMSK